MNKTYLFAIASILAVASLMAAGTFATSVIAQNATTPGGDTGASNMTATDGNATGTDGNATDIDNSTAPM